MSMRPLISLAIACTFAFGMAFWAFSAGLGILGAFLAYSLGGSVSLVAVASLSVISLGRDSEDQTIANYDFELQSA